MSDVIEPVIEAQDTEDGWIVDVTVHDVHQGTLGLVISHCAHHGLNKLPEESDALGARLTRDAALLLADLLVKTASTMS